MRTKPNTVIGIDNGLSGGLCAISAHDGSVIEYIPMPTALISHKSEISTEAIVEWISRYLSHQTLIAIEEPLKHAKSSQAMRSMALSFGKLLGIAETLRYAVERVQVGDWQKPVLGKVPKGKTKQVALAKANARWPDEEWLASPRCKVAHDGIVDAALIAEFARNQM